MSKHHKDKGSYGCCCECCNPCCDPCCDPCCNPCCSGNNMMGNGGFGGFGGFGGNFLGGTACGLWEAILFWLIACGAGLLNTNSILIILLFLLYGWSGDCGCGNGFGW